MAVAKCAVDFVGSQKIMGVSVSPNAIRYRLSNLKHVQYLDLAESKLIIKKVRQEDDGSHFHRLFYQNFVNSELLKYEIMNSNLIRVHYLDLAVSRFILKGIEKERNPSDFDKVSYNKYIKVELAGHQMRTNMLLFRAYSASMQNARSRLSASAIFRYVKLFDLLGMGKNFLVTRETVLFLTKLLREKNIANPALMKAILKDIFIDERIINLFIIAVPFAQEFAPTILIYDSCHMTVSLTNMFHRHHICPILGTAFAFNKTLLDGLIKFNIKKKDFYHILLPCHGLFTNVPVYAAFKPIVKGDLVVLDKKRLTSRDHLVFEIVVATILTKWATVREVNILRDSLRAVYKCLAHPYISRSEMASRLNYLNPSLPESAITSVVCTYKSLFPEIGEETCPRSLQDLCRCAIRDSFNKKFSISAAVDKLKIPNKLMAFLKLEDNDEA